MSIVNLAKCFIQLVLVLTRAEKVKTKIFNNEYIDFGVLISNHLAGEDKYQISIVNGRSGQPSLFFEPSNKPKRIVNIEGWMSAFRIFVTVYTP